MPSKWEHHLVLFNTHYLKHSIQMTGHIQLTCGTNPVHHPLWNLILLHVKHHICSDWLWLHHVTQQSHVWGGQTNYFFLETCLIKLRSSWSSPKSTGTLLTVQNQGIVFPLDWNVFCHVPLHLMLKKWNSSSGVHWEVNLIWTVNQNISVSQEFNVWFRPVVLNQGPGAHWGRRTKGATRWL